jgi:hypothetical protein
VVRLSSSILLLCCPALLLAQAPPDPVPSALEYSTSREAALLPAAAIAPITATPQNERLLCASGELKGKPCRFKWRSALLESGEFLSIQHVGNLPTYRVPHDDFWGRYARSVRSYRFGKWDDGDPFLVNYIGHPMGGAVAGWIEIQNDPAGSVRDFSSGRKYWTSRLRATAWIAAYSAQWELGPLSETSFGNLGSWYYVQHDTRKYTNGTGLVDLVVTPVAGTAWIVGEDAIDHYAIRRLERVSNNRLYLFAVSFLNPNRSFANLLRWKAPWYRDARNVRYPHLAEARLAPGTDPAK